VPSTEFPADKRADITASLPGRKLNLELKRDIHPELWSAPSTQFDRFYTAPPCAATESIYHLIRKMFNGS
jgi:hypothetical protein